MENKSVSARFWAFVIDAALFAGVLWGLLQIFPNVAAGECYSGLDVHFSYGSNGAQKYYGLCGLSAGIYLLFVPLYYVLMEWKLGGTLGKLILGMRVVKVDGSDMDLKAAVIRTVLRVVDFLPLFYLVGALCVRFTENKQRIGDLAAGTKVVAA